MNFKINKKKLYVKHFNFNKKFIVHSGIKNYSVNINSDSVSYIKNEITNNNNIAIIDKFIFEYYFKDIKNKKRILIIKSSEKIKNLTTSNYIIDSKMFNLILQALLTYVFGLNIF